ncbi:MAG: YbaB/EbfC family nucleoid-associated protein [Phycisphaeraceae bacterium]|nr:YbaB/EbfC family nucleoid-associated protein [Phycisphaeraceae bacterium]
MLDALKAAGAIAGLMKNKDAMKAATERIKIAMKQLRCEGAAGGGAARVVVSGDLEVLSVALAPALALSLTNPAGVEQAERLIVEAANKAIHQAKEESRKILTREAEAMGLGDLVSGSGGPFASLMGS